MPGGVVLYETFTTAQRALGTGPTSPDHLLEPGELQALAARIAAREVDPYTAAAALIGRWQ